MSAVDVAQVVTRCPHEACGWTYVGPADRGQLAIPGHLERMHGGRDPRSNGHDESAVLEPGRRQPKPRGYWTRIRVVDALRDWHAEHGRWPTSTEWMQAGDHHPAAIGVRKMFGGWAAAIEAAEDTSPGPAKATAESAPALREAPPASVPLTIEELTDSEKLDGWRDLLLAEADRCERRAAAYRVIEEGLAMLDEASA